MIRSFKELAKEQEPLAGGKGRTLARLYGAGYRVPDGFVILPAAFVARELGIPAVVGCGDATMRLKTGDPVRVNGGQGFVEILRRS